MQSSLAISALIRPAATNWLIPCFSLRIDRNSFPRLGETGPAPFLIASRKIIAPSVPLRPTTPPIPAMGLRMNPILANYPPISLSRSCPFTCQLYFREASPTSSGEIAQNNPLQKTVSEKKGVVSQYFSRRDRGSDSARFSREDVYELLSEGTCNADTKMKST